ncbi:hypothetical protein Pta02_67800 [Planobispora takensis]|uniref:Uncharacterized protein n=1 Tax=Planobispora takensis TaxID=1367882 RepID=A0A8J3T296_9ACTN|nr:hypothetical protein Pta02_67800 [Planobispora takensis]
MKAGNVPAPTRLLPILTSPPGAGDRALAVAIHYDPVALLHRIRSPAIRGAGTTVKRGNHLHLGGSHPSEWALAG